MAPAHTSLSLSLCPPVSLMPSLSPSPGGSAGALTTDSPQRCFVNAPGIRSGARTPSSAAACVSFQMKRTASSPPDREPPRARAESREIAEDRVAVFSVLDRKPYVIKISSKGAKIAEEKEDVCGVRQSQAEHRHRLVLASLGLSFPLC